MELIGVTKLIAYINGLDPRCQVNEVRIAAWSSLLNEHCQSMPYEFAQKVVTDHYAKSSELLYPEAVVKAWKKQRDEQWNEQMTGGRSLESTPMPEWFRDSIKSIGEINEH